MKWDDSHTKRLIELYQVGHTHQAIADFMGVSRMIVRGRIDKLLTTGELEKRKRTSNGKIRITPVFPVVEELIDPAIWEDGENPVPLLEAQWWQCKWPVGDPLVEQTFCGGIAEAESYYCTRHHRMAHRS